MKKEMETGEGKEERRQHIFCAFCSAGQLCGGCLARGWQMRWGEGGGGHEAVGAGEGAMPASPPSRTGVCMCVLGVYVYM